MEAVMNLLYKPDFEETKIAWRHFWNKEAWKRPLVVCDVPKPVVREYRPSYMHAYWQANHKELWARRVEDLEAHFAGREYLAESMPFSSCDFGPDQFAAFISGSTLKFEEGSKSTNWHDPVVEDWAGFEARINEAGPVWSGIMEYAKFLSDAARGRFLVGVCDLHSNMDTLSALRGPERLCMDLLDSPELIQRAMEGVRKLYVPVYEALRKASGIDSNTGSIGWIPFWCEGRYAVIQCDFMCMVSPDVVREFIRPALEEEAAYLDHCIFHLDGPGALRHIDEILSIDDIDAVQWVSGDGQRPMHEWLDVLKKIQASGKGLQIYGVNPEQVKLLHKELSPAGVVYCVNSNDKLEVERLLGWLEANM